MSDVMGPFGRTQAERSAATCLSPILFPRSVCREARRTAAGRRRLLMMAAACLLCLVGCHQDMWNQPKFTAHQANVFFPDNASSRTPVPGTVPYSGSARAWTSPVFAELTGQATTPPASDARFWRGVEATGGFSPDNYFPVTNSLLLRGRERFEVNCTPCHGLLGDGNGVVTTRGFPQAASYHIDRLREVEDGYLFDVMTRGFGRMYSYAARVAPEDRWAIAAYIRALQYSQNARMEDLSPEERERAMKGDEAVADTVHEGHTAGSNDH